jgi:large subunit ribosomal protein L2
MMQVLMQLVVDFYLWQLPLGAKVYNIELIPGFGGILARSAGSFATIIRKNSKFNCFKIAIKRIKSVKINIIS